ncbi:hypothetical protein QTO34_020132 [Cnephaeus nilssonii]|uniref:Uncharacterized protein n=1 Tax=Cnephaeus nilssonii TaxID=3371016 RepID=A0AA40LPY1_CNENI|nr:hypothetical protein QTO34_020132 [Eptesicus nilssonii]
MLSLRDVSSLGGGLIYVTPVYAGLPTRSCRGVGLAAMILCIECIDCYVNQVQQDLADVTVPPSKTYRCRLTVLKAFALLMSDSALLSSLAMNFMSTSIILQREEARQASLRKTLNRFKGRMKEDTQRILEVRVSGRESALLDSAGPFTLSLRERTLFWRFLAKRALLIFHSAVSLRSPALVATAGLTSSTAARKQQKACASEYFSRPSESLRGSHGTDAELAAPRELSVLLAQSATPATLSPAPCASCWPNRGRSGVMTLITLTAKVVFLPKSSSPARPKLEASTYPGKFHWFGKKAHDHDIKANITYCFQPLGDKLRLQFFHQTSNFIIHHVGCGVKPLEHHGHQPGQAFRGKESKDEVTELREVEQPGIPKFRGIVRSAPTRGRREAASARSDKRPPWDPSQSSMAKPHGEAILGQALLLGRKMVAPGAEPQILIHYLVSPKPWSANCGSRATCGSLAP